MSSELNVHFFGGEPFCSPQVVEAAVHRARYQAARFDLKVRFEVSTNGFFSDATCAFVGDYFDSGVLSLDGTAGFHDRQRPLPNGAGSHATVTRNATKLSCSGTELCIRTCVSQDSVGSMKDMAQWLGKIIRPATVSFESLQANADSRERGLEPPDPWQFAAGYFKAYQVLKTMGITAVYAAAEGMRPRHSFCPLGEDCLIISPDGKVHGCYLLEEDWRRRGLDLTYGAMDRQGKMILKPQAIKSIRQVSANHPPRCQHCFAYWYCAGGCKVNQSYPGCTDFYNDFCIQTRMIIACLLLHQIGCRQEVEMLLHSRETAEKLVFQDSDCFNDWNGDDV
jgi:uncharacterized protein